MQRQKLHKIIDNEKTSQKLKAQLSIVRKVVHSIAWLNKNRFDKQILYEISKFLFRNPLLFITPIYKKVDSNKLKIQEKKSYILMNSQIDSQKLKETLLNNHFCIKSIKNPQKSLYDQSKVDLIRKGEYSVHIKVHRCWKNVKINYANSSFKEILMKSRHFMEFLKNVKIDNPKNLIQDNKGTYEGQNLEQKENKLYTLICQNYDYILSKINQIQDNQKNKRFDDIIAKTYVEMMNKNIIILTVDKNNINPISYKSEGKYIYVANHLKASIFSQKFQRIYSNLETFKIEKYLLNLIPYLETNFQGEWFLKNKIPHSLELFQQKGKKIDRGKGIIINRNLKCFQYDDFFIQEII